MGNSETEVNEAEVIEEAVRPRSVGSNSEEDVREAVRQRSVGNGKTVGSETGILFNFSTCVAK